MPRLLTAVLVSMFALLALGAIDAVEAAEPEYVGSKRCRKCHIKEYRSWSETNMANSFEVLKPGERAEAKTAAGLDPQKDYTRDEECVRCHSTGYGKPGGFEDIKSTPDLAGIGCESCHGPGSIYLQDGYMTMENKDYEKEKLVAVGMTDTITEELCTGCHNTDSPFVGDDYVFDFETNKDEGTHEVFPLKYEH